MRQAGVLAAAGLYALRHNRKRLKEDHDHARALGESLEGCGWAQVDMDRIETNILFARTPGLDGKMVEKKLKEQGVRVSATAPEELRLVTSLCVNSEDIRQACRVFETIDFS